MNAPDTLDDALRSSLHRHLDAAPSPSGALADVRARGRRLRRRRRAATGAGVLTLAVAGVATATLLTPSGDGPDATVPDFAPVGQLEFADGLRAYAAPGGEIHLGGRRFERERLAHLDTDAAATPYGVVFFAAGVPHLLAEDGTTTALEEPAAEGAPAPRGAAMDAENPWVAYAYRDGAAVSVVVRDLRSGEEVARRVVDCADSGCDTRVDGLDAGAVFLRDEEGTVVWDVAADTVERFAGAGTRVADVRGGVVLHDGPRPDGPAAERWRPVRGPVDGQLTFDGEHVLSWSSTLQPTRAGGRPLELERGPGAGEQGLAWWALDTDGSVLVAESVDYPRTVVWDCALPSGDCTRLGPLSTTSGDPVFLGNDM